jgi:hypothetical protein
MLLLLLLLLLPGVLYDMYTVSLDKLVKRAYDRLSVVKVILIILLVLEVSMWHCLKWTSRFKRGCPADRKL